MSTGRHAAKRAAEATEKLAGEQQALLKKEDARRGMKEKDIESQRIAALRSRFGGQASQVDDSGSGQASATGYDGSDGTGQNAMASMKKGQTPNNLMKRDPMKNTLLGMFLDNPNAPADNMFTGV